MNLSIIALLIITWLTPTPEWTDEEIYGFSTTPSICDDEGVTCE